MKTCPSRRHWPVALAFLAACAGAPPGGEAPSRRPVEHVVVAAHFEPLIDWEIKADRHYSGGNAMAESMAAGVRLSIFPCFGFPPCIAAVMSATALIGGAATAISTSRARAAGKDDARGGGVAEIDLSSLASALSLQSRLRRAVADAGWHVRDAEGEASGALRLEARVERIKALSGVPIRNVWVHEMDVSWRLVDPVDSRTVASGGFKHEKVLSFSLRHDEASGRWVGEDDGLFAPAWAQACEEMAARIAQEAVPAIAAYRS
jgi:hypothetical protein